ncbi:aspartate/glutamate racemase family protein [Actinokineospora bangkokensis]|uniref:Hydantoin racemase n=1 Tax=Actinokineospora bangkokensis TaxID=1193682 RepID=A0A1Q9LKH2_9PSEU|nr:aspartate/glutamate racemase family protein [Actinokineospora bangkokensis]OLR92532.1 Asp/Glu racemase [Actinokineospora bangkokensis]
MELLVINPNTSAPMTALVERAARAVAGPGTRVRAVTPAMGPASIESHYDEALAVPGVLAEVAAGERAGVDGYVLACFGDPGLDAAREVATGPVVGIAEAAMRTAMYLGRGFSVVTTLARTTGRARDLAARYGAERACLGVHACGIPVLDLESDPDAVKKVVAACAVALEADGSDAVVLGCAGMAELCAVVSAELGVPVVDGVQAAVLAAQSLVAMGLRGPARGEFAPPPAKPYLGLMAEFTRG